jgi:KaiC/GvpD/RAD55 family RecA-like ATPase
MTRSARRHRRARKRPGSDYNVKEAEVADFLGISPRRLALLRRAGLAPFHIRAFGRVWYAYADLIAFHKLRADDPHRKLAAVVMGSEGTGRFKLLTPAELDNLPEPSWLIEGILPANALAVLYGLPGAGKTFIALSIALSIAAGHEWCGKRTSLGSVLYVAAEGLFGLRLRAQVYQGRHGIVAERIRYLGDAFDLRQPTDIDKFVSSIETAGLHPDLIVLDTLARLIHGADENSSKDIGETIRAMDDLRRRFGATVLLVHHTGKDGEKERGSGALRGAADVMIKCTMRADQKSVSFECDKMKEAEPFPSAIVTF